MYLFLLSVISEKCKKLSLLLKIARECAKSLSRNPTFSSLHHNTALIVVFSTRETPPSFLIHHNTALIVVFSTQETQPSFLMHHNTALMWCFLPEKNEWPISFEQ